MLKRCLYGKHHYRKLHTIISQHITEALDNHKPILALESTIITHGLPYPDNLFMARSVEKICLGEGVTPATIAMFNGKPHIGVSDEMLQKLSKVDEGHVKISRRDIAPSIQQGLTGGTTVSGTMVFAHKCGIDVFATGGIGGVHRYGNDTLDISADLTELGRTPVAVVCAGVKSILDIPRTLEYLETQGVTVATLGPTRDFPAFFVSKSGYHSHTNIASPKDAAELILANKQLALDSGIVIAVPIPEQFAANGEEIEAAIQKALCEVGEKQMTGNLITPYLLQRVSQLTAGRSLQTNLALVRNNVKVGGQVAAELARLKRRVMTRHYNSRSRSERPSCKVSVVGALNIDIICQKAEQETSGKDLVAGSVNLVMGGVARNVVECLTRRGTLSSFFSIIGDDRLGRLALEHCNDVGLSVDNIAVMRGVSTAVAQLMLERGNVAWGVADFTSHQHLTSSLISEQEIRESRYVVMDCDTPLVTGLYVADLCEKHMIPLVLEPTAPLKFRSYVEAGILSQVAMVTPNASEIQDMITIGNKEDLTLPSNMNVPDKFSEIITNMMKCLREMSTTTPTKSILTTLGKDGALYCQHSTTNHLQIIYIPAAPATPQIKSGSGAGDSFLGGFLSSMCSGDSLSLALKLGTGCAFRSLESFDTINSEVSDTEELMSLVRQWEKVGWGTQLVFNGVYKL